MASGRVAGEGMDAIRALCREFYGSCPDPSVRYLRRGVERALARKIVAVITDSASAKRSADILILPTSGAIDESLVDSIASVGKRFRKEVPREFDDVRMLGADAMRAIYRDLGLGTVWMGGVRVSISPVGTMLMSRSAPEGSTVIPLVPEVENLLRRSVIEELRRALLAALSTSSLNDRESAFASALLRAIEFINPYTVPTNAPGCVAIEWLGKRAAVAGFSSGDLVLVAQVAAGAVSRTPLFTRLRVYPMKVVARLSDEDSVREALDLGVADPRALLSIAKRVLSKSIEAARATKIALTMLLTEAELWAEAVADGVG